MVNRMLRGGWVAGVVLLAILPTTLVAQERPTRRWVAYLTEWHSWIGYDRAVALANRTPDVVVYMVRSLSWSPDGTRLAVSSGDQVWVWDTITGARVGTLDAPSEVYSVAWGPGDRRIAAGCPEGSIMLWPSIKRHAPEAKPRGRTRPIGDLERP